MAKQKISEGRNWYVVHTYAGYENAVMRNLKQRIESLGMEEKIYPGYILVDMIVTDDSWYVVRNTPRVTGFVGSGVYPVPIDIAEVEALFTRMSADKVTHAINLLENDAVVIVDGPFKELEGKVSEIDEERGKVKVLVNMFGRETPVELDFLQVKKA